MNRMGKDKMLEQIYFDVYENRASARGLHEKATKVDAGRTLDTVSKWMRAQPNEQTRNYKNYNSYTAPFPKYEFQIDLMDVSSLLRHVAVAQREQPKFGMVCIDVFSN